LLSTFLNQFVFNNFNILFTVTGIFITFVALMSSRDYSYAHKELFYLCNIIYIISFVMIIMTNNWIIFIIGW
jgi:formate hydrogenlyase subunit 3/multisubunit Na+/H+ antiporter MnhD subunit